MVPSRSSSNPPLASSFYGSALKTLPNGDDSLGDNVVRSKILLLGMRKCGKTSIQEVIFNKLPPKQSFYLEMTTRITKHAFDTVIPLEIWDCPGNTTLETLGAPLSQFSTMIFVIDIQDLYGGPISKLLSFTIAAYQENPSINLEVFVHKAEANTDEYRIENFRHIQQRVLDELLDESPEYEQIPINFHLTSIYDHSLHEAFSRVLQKLVGSLPYLEDLLNVFCANSQASKAYLFDVSSRLYVATDASPVDHTHALCSDYLQMLNAFGPLYRSLSASPPRHTLTSRSVVASPTTSLPTSPTQPLSNLSSASSTPAPARPPLPEQHLSSTLTSPSPPNYGTLSPSPISTQTRPQKLKYKNLFYPSASSSLSHTASGGHDTIIYHLITPRLALLALLPTVVFESRRGLVEYNVVFFREGVQEICEVEEESRQIG
ncbi:Gtr1/RagA G protein conserved region-domain-containing protein [Irpex rosettiformis]|uniref:Gtr1/RagA G protein conserved region-domain-containing protein n=1 Tax=Irpex rosettiformis TaxID=378272 RepID=A0ACB8U9G1_9APHY|nr:Gtr1/RagA G protein conserved region-domain-containing protein [Irpex rosettiformis]